MAPVTPPRLSDERLRASLEQIATWDGEHPDEAGEWMLTLRTREALIAEAAALSTELLREEVRATYQADADADTWEDEPSTRRWAWTHVCEDELERRQELCRCGHPRERHDDTVGCDVIVRGDGTGCRCRGFRLAPEGERDEDTGQFYGHPGDRLRGLE